MQSKRVHSAPICRNLFDGRVSILGSIPAYSNCTPTGLRRAMGGVVCQAAGRWPRLTGVTLPAAAVVARRCVLHTGHTITGKEGAPPSRGSEQKGLVAKQRHPAAGRGSGA